MSPYLYRAEETDQDDLEATLNRLGEEGWVIMTVVPATHSGYFLVLCWRFQRPSETVVLGPVPGGLS